VGLLALLAVSAQLAVPLPGTPIPVTLQDLAVLAVGIVLGPLEGALTVAGYVLLGAAGLSVFSNGHGGLPWLMGPTGGYLIAFPVSALAIGWATERSRPVWMAVPGLLLAQLIFFAGGAIQLALVTGRPLAEAVQLGVVPFLPGAAFKSALVLAFAVALQRWRAAQGSDAASD
jgi:biotin transport system substrate-specific component